MRKKLVSLRSLHKKAWEAWSKWIRQKDADWRGNTYCFTCSALKHWKELDAGHFRHGVLDFYEKNIHPQCTKCNRFLHGNLGEYARMLIGLYGAGILDELRSEAVKRGNKYSRQELEEIIIRCKLSTPLSTIQY